MTKQSSPLARLKAPQPPEPDSAQSQLARLKGGARVIQPISWPGKPEVIVGLRVLRGSEITAAELGAMQLAKQVPDSPHLRMIWTEVYLREVTVQLVFRALVDHTTGEPFAGSVDELRDLVEIAELEVLADELDKLSASANPALASTEELLEQADDLGKASASGMPSSGTSEGRDGTSSESPRSTSPTASSPTSSPAPGRSSTDRPPTFRQVEAPAATSPASSSDPGSTSPTDS
mgnify:CR=1 FL=1